MSLIKKQPKVISPLISTKPVVDISPRVESSGNSLRYEFRSFEDLVACCQKGTFVLETRVVDDKFEETGRINATIQGRYSDGGLGNIYIGLKTNTLDSKIPYGSSIPSLHYSFLQPSDKDYAKRSLTEDTQEVFQQWNEFIRPQLNAIMAKYFPQFTESLHVGKDLKFKLPKGSTVKRYTENGEETLEEVFKIDDHMKSRGKLMVKVGVPWFMDSRGGLQNKLMGVSYSLARIKYLTDEEKKVIEEEKASVKRIEEYQRKQSRPVTAPASKKVKREETVVENEADVENESD